jgi:hypothetical protein
MNRKLSSSAIRSLVMIVLVATTFAKTVPDHNIKVAQPQDQTSRSSFVAPPLVLAQGRCYNGRCY